MSATLTIDDELYLAAKQAAEERALAVDDYVAELVRDAVQHRTRIIYENGIPIFHPPPGTPTLTSEDVRRAEEEAY